MKADSTALLWLKWKQTKSNTLYWLSLIGFDADSSPFYLVYLFGFWLFWVFAMWAFLVDQVELASKNLPDEFVTSMPNGIPLLLMMGYLIYVIASLFNQPLKFTAPDIAYLVTSPVSRGALALVQFVQALFIPAVLLSLVSTLIAMLLTWPTDADQVGLAGVQALILALPMIYCLVGWTWIIGVIKQTDPKRALWLIPVIVILMPLPVSLMGRAWVLSIDAQLTPPVVVPLLGFLAVTLFILGRISSRLHLSRVADQSRTYARIQRLGMLGRIYARTVIDRIHRQAQLTHKKRLRQHLPLSTSPTLTLWYRALLSLSRLSPKRVFALIGQGVFFTSSVLLLTQSMGWKPPQVWIIIAIQFVQIRPSALIGSYGQDMSQSFLTQFLPADRLLTFVTASFFPILIASWGGIVVALLLPIGNTLVIVALVILTAIALALCQAMELGKEYQSIPYEYGVLLYGVLVVGAGYLLASLWAALIAAAAFVGVAGMILE